MYANGDGVPKDFDAAVKRFRKAAEQGHAVAEFNLGVCYDEGWGVVKDRQEAVRWLAKAANQGLERAKAKLHKMPFTWPK
jgi:uncharacterized protein